MRASIVQIGNSRGIRIPKELLKQCRLTGEVELEPGQDELVIRSLAKARQGWEEAFRRMAEESDDRLLDRESFPRTEWERSEWKW
jgi:antitoxin MazE